MHRNPFFRDPLLGPLLIMLLTGMAGALACGPSGKPGGEGGAAEPGAHSQAAGAEWSWLQATKQDLDRRRAALATEGADPKLARETADLALEFNRRLVEIINADPPVQGEPASERQQAAIRMKSDEEIVLAHQFIEQGGDYQRAIEIYKEALAVDPGNPRLREELTRAQARQYLTRQAFAKVKEGMEPDEVRSLLGQPNLHNVRQYPDRGVIGWFYPKDASGAAAAVWFHKEAGRTTVYLLDFDALDPLDPKAPPAAPAPPGRAA